MVLFAGSTTAATLGRTSPSGLANDFLVAKRINPLSIWLDPSKNGGTERIPRAASLARALLTLPSLHPTLHRRPPPPLKNLRIVAIP